MLLNPRYRGVYIHGRVKKVRRGGKLIRVQAEPGDVITVDVPEWRIVDDATWFAVQEKFAKRARKNPASKGRPTSKYPLTGIAKCGVCGGAIGCASTKRRGGRVKSYACMWHHKRGSTVCPVAVHQPMNEVEDALIEHLAQHILTESVVEMVMGEIKREVQTQMPERELDISALETELRTTRAEQRKLAKAVALADDIPELVAELQQRSARIRHLEAQLEAAQRTPEEVVKVMKRVEIATRLKLDDIRTALSERSDLRQVFLALFPDGLTFHPEWADDQTVRRRVWRVQGSAKLGAGSNLNGDPNGI